MSHEPKPVLTLTIAAFILSQDVLKLAVIQNSQIQIAG